MTTTAAPTAPTYTNAQLADIAEPSVKDLRRFIARFDRWHALCAEVTLTKAAMNAEPSNMTAQARYRNAQAAWSKGARSMPSKNAKHRAYGSADHIRRCLGDDLAPRPSDVNGLRVVVAAADRWIRFARQA